MPRVPLLLALALAACSRSSAPAPDPAPSLTPDPAPSLALAPSLTPALARPPARPCRSLADRTTEAQTLYGPSVHLATVDGTFLYVDPDHSPLFSEALRRAPPALAALRNDRIAPHVLCPVSVYVFASPKSLLDHCAQLHYVHETGAYLGLYDGKRGEIVVDLTEGARYLPNQLHELAHVLMDADFEAPLWFRECVASQYESPVPNEPPGVIHGSDDWRYMQLRAAVLAKNPEVHLGALFGMSDDEFRGRRDAGGADGTRSLLHRGTARAVCQWLDGEGRDQLWGFYRAWRDAGTAADPDGVAAFTSVTGEPRGTRMSTMSGSSGCDARGDEHGRSCVRRTTTEMRWGGHEWGGVATPVATANEARTARAVRRRMSLPLCKASLSRSAGGRCPNKNAEELVQKE